MPDGTPGQLFVSTHGFYMSTADGLFPWTWPAITSASMVGPGLVDVVGTSTNGELRWQLSSEAAELLFGLWALAQHPRHPQLSNREWLPPAWRSTGELDPTS